LEDIMEEPAPRMFWPREIWGRYAGELADFKALKNRCVLFAALYVDVFKAHMYTQSCCLTLFSMNVAVLKQLCDRRIGKLLLAKPI
jgi:farnesyl-diphosphate farnesyltransferase